MIRKTMVRILGRTSVVWFCTTEKTWSLKGFEGGMDHSKVLFSVFLTQVVTSCRGKKGASALANTTSVLRQLTVG